MSLSQASVGLCLGVIVGTAALIMPTQGTAAEATLPARGTAQALERFQQPGEGWYFYRDPKVRAPPQPVTPPTPLPPPPAPTFAKPAPPKALSVAWIRQHLPLVTDAAIDEPTPENIRTFLYMQRVMLDKSDVFATVAARMGSSDPALNEDARAPSLNALKFGQALQRLGVKDTALKSLATQTGLWIFVDGKCPFCKMGVEISRTLANRAGIPLRIISLDGRAPDNVKPGEFVIDVNRAAARRFGVRVIPATVLVAPPDKVAIVAHGAVNSGSELEEKVLTAANEFGILKADTVLALNARERGIIKPNDLRDLLSASAGRSDDQAGAPGNENDPTPQQIMQHVQRLLNARIDEDALTAMKEKTQ